MSKKEPNNDKPQQPLNSEVVDREFVKEKRPNNENKKEQQKAK